MPQAAKVYPNVTLMPSKKIVTPAKAGGQKSCNSQKKLASGFQRKKKNLLGSSIAKTVTHF